MLTQIRKKIADEQGFNCDGSLESFNALPDEPKAQMTNSVLRYVASNPEEFSPALVADANRIVNEGGILPPNTYNFKS